MQQSEKMRQKVKNRLHKLRSIDRVLNAFDFDNFFKENEVEVTKLIESEDSEGLLYKFQLYRNPDSMKQLRSRAKALNIPNYSRLSKNELIWKIEFYSKK